MAEKKSLSEQFSELEKIAAKFESGQIDLEEGIKEFEKGLKLAKELRERLTKIEGEIRRVKAKYVGGEEAERVRGEPEESPF